MKNATQVKSYAVKQMHQLEATGLSNEQARVFVEIVAEQVRSIIKEEIAALAIKEKIAKLATKEDFAKLATKEEITNLATKEELAEIHANMATKEEIAKLVTTRDFLTSQVTMMERFDKKFNQLLLTTVVLIVGMMFTTLGFLPYLGKLWFGG